MADPQRNFEVVGQEPDAPAQRPVDRAAFNMVMLGIKTLSQRALAGFQSLFTLITVGLAFWLAMAVSAPTSNQLIQQGMFFCFVLFANVIFYRRK